MYSVKVVHDSTLHVTIEGPPGNDTMDREQLKRTLTEAALRMADRSEAEFVTDYGYTDYRELSKKEEETVT